MLKVNVKSFKKLMKGILLHVIQHQFNLPHSKSLSLLLKSRFMSLRREHILLRLRQSIKHLSIHNLFKKNLRLISRLLNLRLRRKLNQLLLRNQLLQLLLELPISHV